MNSIVAGDQARGRHSALLGALHFVLGAVRSLTWKESGFFLLIALVVCSMYMSLMLDLMLAGKKGGGHLLLISAAPLLAVPFVLVGWAIADRADGSPIARGWRLALGIAAGAAATVLIAPPVLDALGIAPSLFDLMEEPGKEPSVPIWASRGSYFLEICFYAGIGALVLEMNRRRARALQALSEARRDQAQLARELLESRLAAMQAQVEPHFLFDSLVDIQATYDDDSGRGADVMDRLITYLRVALPRLREAGSTVQAEADLLEAYLAVVSARHGGRPVARLTIAADCAQSRFSPMLLLPLIQRAMRDSARGEVPERIELDARLAGNEVVAGLQITSGGLCADDAELARVRDRLAGLYDGRARLECDEPRPGVSRFTLCVPR